tara:strand:- start:340 stop:489 length:150 start_codon:yes stop_codon:yes gene_type:complete
LTPLNPDTSLTQKNSEKNNPPLNLDDAILGRMIKEAGMFYQMELERGER